MPSDLTIRAAATADDLARLRAFIAAEQGEAAARALDDHLARPRYRPEFTCIAEGAAGLAGYALIGHERRRLGAATLETGVIERIYAAASEQQDVLAALIGGCLRALVEHALPLATLRGPAELIAPFGFAPYRFEATALVAGGLAAPAAALRTVLASDLDDLAALYEANYHGLPLSAIRAAPDWRAWLAAHPAALALEDRQGRLVGYAVLDQRAARDELRIVESGVVDSGAARALCAALLERAGTEGRHEVCLALPPAHLLARAALHLGGVARLAAQPEAGASGGVTEMAGVVDLPGLLEALAPEFERRLAGSRYADWSGNLRVELDTERITLTLANGRATVIDGSRPADVRLRNVALPALAQLCLGYRDAADLRATAGLACDDAALGLIDALFPAVFAALL